MRAFYLGWEIRQTASAKFQARIKSSPFPDPAASAAFPSPDFAAAAGAFPLSWSQYVRLLSVENSTARAFYEAEAIRGGWSVRQLDRQSGTQFYERVALSKNQAAMLTKGELPTRLPDEAMLREEMQRTRRMLELRGPAAASDHEE
jgi:hypothetical protein